MTENTKVMKREEQQVAPAGSMLEVIARAVANPNVDVAKMEKLLDMQERIVTEERRVAFANAMAKLQARLPQISKDGRIVVNGQERSRYARLEDIDVAIRPLLAEFGFSFSFNEESVEGKSRRYSAKISHEDGHSETKYMTLTLDESGSKNAAQSAGSTFAYARRYLLKAHLNLIERDEDTDANETDLINEEQVREINTLILDTKSDKQKFLTLIAGVDAIEKIQARDFQRVMNALVTKARTQK